MPTDALRRAVSASRPVLVSVQAEQLAFDTPCASWKVRDLVNHMIVAPTFAAVVAETGDFSSQAGAEPVDQCAGDYLADYDAATNRAIRAFEEPGVMEKTVKLPFGEMPASVFLQIAAGDAFTHGWDLAKATGQSTRLDDELASELLGAIEPLLPDSLRGPDGKAPFGPKVDVSEEAPAADRLAGFLGRRP